MSKKYYDYMLKPITKNAVLKNKMQDLDDGIYRVDMNEDDTISLTGNRSSYEEDELDFGYILNDYEVVIEGEEVEE